MSNNKAPFHIGQRVVALKTSGKKMGYQIVKGKIYTVQSIFLCRCKEWVIQILEMPATCAEATCCHEENRPLYFAGKAKNFAPITTRSVEIDETIKEQAEEMLRVKETIKELNPSLC